MRASMLWPSFRHFCSLGRLRWNFRVASCRADLGTAGGCTSSSLNMPWRPSSTRLKGSMARNLHVGQAKPVVCCHERRGTRSPQAQTSVAAGVPWLPACAGTSSPCLEFCLDTTELLEGCRETEPTDFAEACRATACPAVAPALPEEPGSRNAFEDGCRTTDFVPGVATFCPSDVARLSCSPCRSFFAAGAFWPTLGCSSRRRFFVVGGFSAGRSAAACCPLCCSVGCDRGGLAATSATSTTSGSCSLGSCARVGAVGCVEAWWSERRWLVVPLAADSLAPSLWEWMEVRLDVLVAPSFFFVNFALIKSQALQTLFASASLFSWA
mmetsp:Transcript_113198/g.315189  ORF Transcript_113198/g.315189 Transcript_113198/m.315189 type:complete len:325 (+) Transcript_113198:1193-2167(+)